MSGKLRYGCVGAGGIANKKHLNEYSKLQNVEMVAICDTNRSAAEKMAEKFNIPQVYTDYREMFEKASLDLVSVCTPNYLHMPVSVDALKAGIHVHCEKPVAMNQEEAQLLAEAKNKYGRKVMAALNNRFTSEAAFVKKYVEAGMLGEIYHAKCGWRRRNGIPGKGAWFTNKQLSGGGPLIDLGVHFLDLTLFFMGYPAAASVVGTTYSKFPDSSTRIRPGYKIVGDGIFDVEDMAVGFVRLENDATIDFEFSWASNIEKECKYYEILGTKGGVSYANGELKIFSEVMGTSVNIVPELNGTIQTVNEFQHFTDCIVNGREPIAPVEEAVRLMKIIDAIYKSSETRREVLL